MCRRAFEKLVEKALERLPGEFRRFEDSGDLPPIIALYQGPLEEDFPDRGELAREVEITLVHELAHFMGFDEDAVREFGYE